ncbi:MAG: hypothetical protein JST85_17960 [Acidobacteria bacterium]|nr:hypothetical protein [Acidobacteriota bacterium]
MTRISYLLWQAALVAAMLLMGAVCSLFAAAQSLDRAQQLSEIIALQNQLRTATDPVQIATLEGQLKVKETVFLQPDATDFTTNAAFLAQPDAGLIRILPREKFDGVLSTRGGGAYYSFVRLVHEYGFGSDLSLEQNNFKVGFAGADFGFLVSLGATDLGSVTLDHPAVKYLASFTAPLVEAEARQQYQRSGQGFTENGFFYRSYQPKSLDAAYALRSVDYDDSDVLIVFRFVREDTDGSLILQWKLLRRFSTPQLNSGSIASVSAASYRRGAFARDSIVALFGNDLTTTTEVAGSLPLPFTLAGVRVSFSPANSGGKYVSLFAATPGQANFLIPSDAPNGWGFITVSRANNTSFRELVRIAPVAPGLFTANSDGKGVPAAVALRIEQNGTQTYSSVARLEGGQYVPASIDLGAQSPGSVWPKTFLLLYGTGIRGYGDIAKVKVTIDGVDVPVYAAAAVLGYAGLDQVNAEIPQTLAGRGEVDVVLTVDGQVANTVRINIK